MHVGLHSTMDTLVVKAYYFCFSQEMKDLKHDHACVVTIRQHCCGSRLVNAAPQRYMPEVLVPILAII